MTTAARDSRVSLVACADYDRAEIQAAVEHSLSPLGGMSAFVSPGDRVLIKPNLLMKAGPDRAVTTHPEIVRAVVRLARECGGEVTVGDSPGGRATKGMGRAIFEASGLGPVCAEEGARLVLLDDEVTRVPAEGGKLYTSFNIGREVADADVVINLPKLKTHGFMMLTAGVKNLFGCIPGLEKAQFHLKVPDRDDFGDMLVDLLLACRPALTILDGVVGMEGEGPSGGNPRRIGVIMASADAFALDAVAAAVCDFDPMDVYTSRAAARRGLGPERADDVEVVGVPWRTFSIADFEKPAPDVDGRIPAPVRKWLRKRVASRPFLERRPDCTGCRTCEKNCPVTAIEMVGGNPSFDYDACIRCYCCQELCPEQAIGLRTPGVARMFISGGRGHKA